MGAFFLKLYLPEHHCGKWQYCYRGNYRGPFPAPAVLPCYHYCPHGITVKMKFSPSPRYIITAEISKLPRVYRRPHYRVILYFVTLWAYTFTFRHAVYRPKFNKTTLILTGLQCDRFCSSDFSDIPQCWQVCIRRRY
jgi:hypothetical protein